VHPAEGLFLERAVPRSIHFVVSPDEKKCVTLHPLTKNMNLIAPEKKDDDPAMLIGENQALS